MNIEKMKFGESLRIIWAIAAKDIVDGLKNKSILSSILTVLFWIVLYKGLPILTAGSSPPQLALYDAGESQLIAQLENSADVWLRQTASQESLERYLGSENVVVLGLTLPPDFDQITATSAEINLSGYVDHWASDAAIVKTQTHFENLFTTLLGKPVHITIQHDKVFTQPDGGQAFFVSLSVVVLLFIFGLSIAPTLMLEERETHTMDALLVSPASNNQVIMGKSLAGLTYCIVGMALILAFNAALVVHWSVILAAVILGALFLILLGLFVGTVIKTKQHLGLWTMGLAQPLVVAVALLPLYGILPGWLLTIFNGIPTVALGKVVRISLLAEAPFSEYGLALAYVAGWTLLLFVGVVWRLGRMQT